MIVDVVFIILTSVVILCQQECFVDATSSQSLTANSTNTMLYEETATMTPVYDPIFLYNNCSLLPAIVDIGEHVANLVDEGYQLIKIRLKINGNTSKAINTNRHSIYNIWHWTLTNSESGKALLMLQESFEAMSLYTLSHGVSILNITLNQEPNDCLAEASPEDLEMSIRQLILNNFKTAATSFIPNMEVCNQHVKETPPNTGSIVYHCCDLSLNHAMHCYELKESISFRILRISIAIIQMAIILYSPLLLPKSLFSARLSYIPFIFTTESNKSITLRVKKVERLSDNLANTYSRTKQHSFVGMKTFCGVIDTLSPETPHMLKVNSVVISQRPTKMLTEGQAPLSLLSFIKDFILRCNMRNELASIRDCCNKNMLSMLPGQRYFPWYKCLRIFSMSAALVLVTSPWWLRIVFYISEEEVSIRMQTFALSARKLWHPFTGNLVTYLGPFHVGFVFVYLFLFVGAMLYVLLSNNIKRKIKFTVRKCFRDMNATRKLDICGHAIKKTLWPLEQFGIIGCLVMPLWLLALPIFVILVAAEVIPIVNLNLRLLINFVYYLSKIFHPQMYTKQGWWSRGKLGSLIKSRLKNVIVIDELESNTRSNKVIHAVALLYALVANWCVILLVVECLSFYVGCGVYILIGFILRPDNTMKYSSLLLLICVYGYECFAGVSNVYTEYGKTLHKKIQGSVEDDIVEVAALTADKQKNVAFRMRTDDNSKVERMKLVAGSEGYLKWFAPRLLLLLDKNDIPYISKRLLFRLATLPHSSCPGPAHVLYLKGLIDFLKILVFLMFVFLVVFAFGQASDISSGSQVIAALGSGLLPLIFRKFLFQSHGNIAMEQNLNWQMLLKEAIQAYGERWVIDDIHVSITRPSSSIDIASHTATTILEEMGDLNMNEFDEDKDKSVHALLNQPCNYANERDVDLVVIPKLKPNGEDGYDFFVPRILDYRDSEELFDEEMPNTARLV